MIRQEQEHATSLRFAHLAQKLRSKKYRDSYVSSHTKMFLANQIAAMRGGKSQEEFGELLKKPQSVVSRLQNPTYGKYSLQTLLDVASKNDVAIVVRFVDYLTFLKITNDFSDEAVHPTPFDPSQLDLFVSADNSPTFASIDRPLQSTRQFVGGDMMGGAPPISSLTGGSANIAGQL